MLAPFLSWLSLAPSLGHPLPARPQTAQAAWLEEVPGLCLDLDSSCCDRAQNREDKVLS